MRYLSLAIIVSILSGCTYNIGSKPAETQAKPLEASYYCIVLNGVRKCYAK